MRERAIQGRGADRIEQQQPKGRNSALERIHDARRPWDHGIRVGHGGAGVIFAKGLNLLSGVRFNPLIGAARISAFPMASRVVNRVGLGA
jgi:hypothetical protein